MPIPDTNAFSLQDVIDVVQPVGGDSLLDCLAEADDSLFDVKYKGQKNSLLNFRNYDAP